MTEEHRRELIKCSCCKCFYFDKDYDVNRLGTKYKTSNKCRQKRLMYQDNYKKKKIYEQHKHSNSIVNNSMVEENNKNIVNNSIEKDNNNKLPFCNKCNNYVEHEVEISPIIGNTVCLLCILTYQESKLQLLGEF